MGQIEYLPDHGVPTSQREAEILNYERDESAELASSSWQLPFFLLY
jgi:hypothetical protein